MSQITVQFLGSGDAFGSGGRLQTCIYVQTPSEHCLLDCGATSLVALRRYGVDPALIDVVLLTHLHGDHFGGLPFFILEAQLLSKRKKPLLVAGPPGLEERIHTAMEVFFPGSAQVQQNFALEFIELPERVATTVRNLQVTPYPVHHASGAKAYALRVACAGKVLAYSGDTEWTDSLLEVGKEAALFICEAYVFEKKLKYHLSYRTLAEHRPELGCRRLIITHMGSDLLARLSEVEFEYAEDGRKIVL